MTHSDDSQSNQQHRAKMQRIKTARDKMMASKTAEKGLIIVHTGKGKGKSSAAFGMVFRCIAHGIPSAVVQFIKGAMDSGERHLIETHFSDLCSFHAMGHGFTWETQNKQQDITDAENAWQHAQTLITNPHYKLVLLDEINIALRYGYITADSVIDFLTTQKPQDTHVILTGRNAPESIVDIADLATDMVLLKHPFRSGIKAQKGIEY